MTVLLGVACLLLAAIFFALCRIYAEIHSLVSLLGSESLRRQADAENGRIQAAQEAQMAASLLGGSPWSNQSEGLPLGQLGLQMTGKGGLNGT
jgi:hypothetical protein